MRFWLRHNGHMVFSAAHPALGQRYLATYGEGTINLFGRLEYKKIYLSSMHDFCDNLKAISDL